MPVHLTFRNPNVKAATTINIYREDWNESNPTMGTGVIVGTISGFESNFYDRSTETLKTYWYRFEVLSGNKVTSVSPPIKVKDVDRYGPSSSPWEKPVGGAYAKYFEPVNVTAGLPGPTELYNLMGGSPAAIKGIPEKWHKFTVDGKIYFMPYKWCVYVPEFSRLEEFYREYDLSIVVGDNTFTFDVEVNNMHIGPITGALNRSDSYYNPEQGRTGGSICQYAADLTGITTADKIAVIVGKYQDTAIWVSQPLTTASDNVETKWNYSYNWPTTPQNANIWRPVIEWIPPSGGILP